jgi:hypothetical protein
MSGMPTEQRAPSRHWLLPQERWFGRFLTRHEANPPLPQQVRFQQNYGPDGNLFFAAAGVDTLAGGVMGLSGALLASITQHGLPAAIGYWLAGAGILSAVLGIVRGLQVSRAGKAFRAGRPFIRQGQPPR